MKEQLLFLCSYFYFVLDLHAIMLIMFKFYCELVDFQKKLQQFDNVVESTSNLLNVYHCAYETQLACVCLRAMELLNGGIQLESGVLTPADITVLVYVITNAPNIINTLLNMPCLLLWNTIGDKITARKFDYSVRVLYSSVRQLSSSAQFSNSAQLSPRTQQLSSRTQTLSH